MFFPYIVCHSETNLKVKQALTVTAELGEDLQKLTEFNGEYKWKIHFTDDLPKLERVVGTLPAGKIEQALCSLLTGVNTTCKGKGPSSLAGLGATHGYDLTLHWWQFLWMDTFLLSVCIS